MGLADRIMARQIAKAQSSSDENSVELTPLARRVVTEITSLVDPSSPVASLLPLFAGSIGASADDDIRSALHGIRERIDRVMEES